MRVLQCIGSLGYGGSQTFIMEVYRKIDREKLQFDFVVFPEKIDGFYHEVKDLGGRVFVCPRYQGTNHFEFCKWWSVFLSAHPEYQIIHGHVRSCAILYLGIAQKLGRKTIIHSHSTSNGMGVSAVVKAIMQYPLRHQADYLFACSDFAGAWLFGKKSTQQDNYRIISNCIDLDRFAFDEQTRSAVRQSLGLQEADLVIGHIGRFSEPKNHPFLIRVFQEIRKKNKRAQLLLIGGGQKQAEIEELVSQQGLSACVHFLGIQKRPELFYQAMDVFLFPSLWEGLPVGVVEAQASGLPCVVSDVITKQVCLTDLVVSVSLRSSAEEWADVVLRCVRPQRCGLNAGQRLALSGFDSRAVAAELTKFYLEIGKHE